MAFPCPICILFKSILLDTALFQMEERICMMGEIAFILDLIRCLMETLADRIPRDHNHIKWISSAPELPFFLWKIWSTVMPKLQAVLVNTQFSVL